MIETACKEFIMRLEKLRKRLRIGYFVFWMVVSFLMGIISALFFEEPFTWKVIAALIVPVFLSALGINYYWNQQFVESVRLLFPVLDRDPDQFIADFEELTAGKHTRKIVASTYYNNMGTAYARKKCYREALTYYNKVNTRKLPGAEGKAVYWGNVALMRFLLEENEQALAILQEYASVFQRFPLGTECKNAPDLPLLVARLEIHRQMALGNWEEAETLLRHLREYAVKPIIQEGCDELEQLLAKKRSVNP